MHFFHISSAGSEQTSEWAIYRSTYLSDILIAFLSVGLNSSIFSIN